MKKYLTYIIPVFTGGLFLFILFLALKPIKINRENSIEFEAVVRSVDKGRLNNISIAFKGVPRIYTISGAAQKALNADTLRKQMANKRVKAYYLKPGFFSRFHPMTDVRNITEVRLDDKIIYSELQNAD